jgi:hypothetical protein
MSERLLDRWSSTRTATPIVTVVRAGHKFC